MKPSLWTAALVLAAPIAIIAAVLIAPGDPPKPSCDAGRVLDTPVSDTEFAGDLQPCGTDHGLGHVSSPTRPAW